MYILLKIIFLTTWVYLLSLNSSISKEISPATEVALPKIEAGVGAFYAQFPHYPSARTNFSLALPYPTLIYRGDILRADENGGFRTRFFKNQNFEINLSLGGALPVSSEKIQIREGMPNLKTMVELGPGLIWHIIPRKSKNRFKLSLNLPVRWAYAMDFDYFDDRGLVINPILFGFARLYKKLRMFYFTSYRWSSREFQQSFFEVAPKHATAKRQQYRAKRGSTLASIGLGFSQNLKERFQIFVGSSYINYSLNPNRDSPLYQSNSAYSYVFGITWWFYKSESKVSAIKSTL